MLTNFDGTTTDFGAEFPGAGVGFAGRTCGYGVCVHVRDVHTGPSSGGDGSGTVSHTTLSSLRLMGKHGPTKDVVANERSGMVLVALGKGVVNERSSDFGASPREAWFGMGPSTRPCLRRRAVLFAGLLWSDGLFC